MAGCLIRGRRRWSVTYTSPRGLRISEFFRIWNRRAFQERKPYQFPGWTKNSPYYCPGRGANPRPPAHPNFITIKESHTLLVRPYENNAKLLIFNDLLRFQNYGSIKGNHYTRIIFALPSHFSHFLLAHSIMLLCGSSSPFLNVTVWCLHKHNF